MLELLAPAGSMESVTAAVQNGAGAVYLGYGDFNARRNAKNFSEEEVAAAVSYCHNHGCRVHLTLNTLLTDRELPGAARVAAHASDIGIDAVIVQDLGVAKMLRNTVPDMEIHGSTQMTIHSLDGVKACADLGMDRVVLSRELSREQIAYICQRSPIEIEVFGHGALCMCYSGQCFFSSVIGGRSGNRGLCAQPCRLKYGWNGKADSYPLSLKDASLACYLQELEDMGVACLKLEGRMKRPEYVATITGIYARALREKREPTAEELRRLEQIFSRQGFTQGYYEGKLGADMFGVRKEQKEPTELYAQARASYENGEHRREPVTFCASILAGQPARLTAQDKEGRTAAAKGPAPEAARNVALTEEKVRGQLDRTGGTVFYCDHAEIQLGEGLSLPLAALNKLRRQVLDDLTEQRSRPPERRKNDFVPVERLTNRKDAPVCTLSVRSADQITDELLEQKPALIYLPTDQGAAHPEVIRRCHEMGVPVAALLPRICNDSETEKLAAELKIMQAEGVSEALASTLGVAHQAKNLGFQIRADYGVGVFNSETMDELERMGFISATASFELKLAQIRDISKNLPTEIIAYGRLPLMITENYIIPKRAAQTPNKPAQLTDRRGEHFPVVEAWGHRSEILNGKRLFLANRAIDYSHLGLWAVRLSFTTESPGQCAGILRAYMGTEEMPQPNDHTRGLYYRDVN